MSDTSTKLLIFSAGCLTGATIAFSILKTGFKERLDREITAIKQDYREETAMLKKQLEEQPPSVAKAAQEVARSLEDLRAVFKEATDEEELKIYPITADEFGEQGYDEEQLYFYAADETLADKDDCVVDPDETNVGDDAIDIFLYTDAENTYVRNNETKTDYEIIKVNGFYASHESEGLYE